MGLARKLAEAKNAEAVALLLGGEKAEAEALAQSIGRVLCVSNPNLGEYEASRYVMAIHQLVEKRGRPLGILAGSSTVGLEFMPRLAARLGVGYLSSCVELGWSPNGMRVLRPLFGGKILEELEIETIPAVLTVRPGTHALADSLAEPGDLETIPVDIGESVGMKIVDEKTDAFCGVDILEAPRVVAGGRGMGEAKNFELLEELALTLGAAVGASRSVVDAGWRPHEDQVGKSGKTISPELYVACGISGAIHHVLGMNTAKTVVAINTDPEALIFQNADYGIVGDANQIVPLFSKAVREAKNKG